jgi:hypothetical protein
MVKTRDYLINTKSRYLIHFPISLDNGRSPHVVCTLAVIYVILDSFDEILCISYVEN